MAAPVITIDGPSGSGKGTVGRRVAHHLGWAFLDSGALYRSLAVKIADEGLDAGDEATICATATALDLTFSNEPDDDRVILDGRDVTGKLRTEETGNLASKLAASGPIRAALLQLQRNYRLAPGLVADGRDMGTVVFPDAPLKIFLEASAAERAQRRYKQLKEKGLSANLSRLETEIAERDRRDRGRSVAPLKPAEDAVVVDSTRLSIDQVVVQILTAAAQFGFG